MSDCVYFIKKNQMDNIREIIDNLIDVLKSFHRELDTLEQTQSLDGVITLKDIGELAE